MMLGFGGVTAMDTSAAGGGVEAETVRVVVAEIAPSVPVIVVLPAATAVATPEALMVATDGLEEVQLVCEVTSPAVPSLYVATAWNCWVAAMVTVRLAGLIAIEEIVGATALTVRDAEPVTPFS